MQEMASELVEDAAESLGSFYKAGTQVLSAE